MTSLAILGLTILAVIALTVDTRLHTDSWATGLPSLVVGAALSFGAFSVWKWWPSHWQLSSGLAWLAAPAIAVGLAAAAPAQWVAPICSSRRWRSPCSHAAS